MYERLYGRQGRAIRLVCNVHGPECAYAVQAIGPRQAVHLRSDSRLTGARLAEELLARSLRRRACGVEMQHCSTLAQKGSISDQSLGVGECTTNGFGPWSIEMRALANNRLAALRQTACCGIAWEPPQPLAGCRVDDDHELACLASMPIKECRQEMVGAHPRHLPGNACCILRSFAVVAEDISIDRRKGGLFTDLLDLGPRKSRA